MSQQLFVLLVPRSPTMAVQFFDRAKENLAVGQGTIQLAQMLPWLANPKVLASIIEASML